MDFIEKAGGLPYYIVILKQNIVFDILFSKYRISIHQTQKHKVINLLFCFEFAIKEPHNG